MWKSLIEYFSNRHLLTNFIFIAVFISGVFCWMNTSKEEYPDLTLDRVRISTFYPGASPEEVEHFVTHPIEDELRGVDGIYQITSNSSVGASTITVELEPNYPDKDESIIEIRNTVLDVDLPEDIIEDPEVRVFKTSKKAIIDICLYHKDKHLLDYTSRKELQTYAHALENQLLNLPEINSVNKNGYIQEEIQIRFYPEKLVEYQIPLTDVNNEIKDNHIRQPAGSLENSKDEKVTLKSELDDPEKLGELIIQGGFDEQFIRLKDVAEIKRGYEKNKEILKINGHEGVILSTVKNSSYGILEGIEAVDKTVKAFDKNILKDTNIKVVVLDDESEGVRNRLSIIGTNGAIGFVLILIMLFIFLNFSSGIWVALGIPFTFCFTMIFVNLMGYTINNMTLAGVIIVMGMVVDDAIVVAENITRLHHQGVDMARAAVEGTSFVFFPVIASIVTTCAAFLPIFFFTGRFSLLVKYIPPIIFLMLLGSLFESLFILPAHMGLTIPSFIKGLLTSKAITSVKEYVSRKKSKMAARRANGHWFHAIEDRYERILIKVLRHRWILLVSFGCLLAITILIFNSQLKYVMFPRAETTQFRLEAVAAPETKRFQTAKLSKQIEDVFLKYIGKEVVGFRTEIARRVDVNKIELQVMEKKENLIALKTNYDQTLNSVYQVTRYQPKGGLTPEYPSYSEKINISFHDEYNGFKESSRTYKMLTLLEKKGILEVDRAADDLLPSASLELGYIEEGTGYDIQDKENRAFVGFTFEYPFPGQKENAQHATAKIDLEKVKLTSTNKKVQLQTDLKNLHMQIEKQAELVEIARKKIKVSDAIVNDETKNYSHGKISLNDLIEAINTLEENKFNLIFHKITLNNLMLEWYRLTDRLIERKDIDRLSGNKTK